MDRKILLSLLLACSPLLVQAQNAPTSPNREIAAEVVSIKTPQVEMAEPRFASTEVGMELDNKGNKAHELIAAFSPVAKQVQLHKTVEKNGQSIMEQINHITIKPHNERELQEKGLHVMLIDLQKNVRKGNHVPIVLLFDDGSYKHIKVPVV